MALKGCPTSHGSIITHAYRLSVQTLVAGFGGWQGWFGTEPYGVFYLVCVGGGAGSKPRSPLPKCGSCGCCYRCCCRCRYCWCVVRLLDTLCIPILVRWCEPGIGAEADLTGNSSLITAVTDFNSVLKALSEEHGAPAAARAGAASDADEGAGTKKKRKGTLADSRVTCVPVSMAVAALPCFPMRAVAVGVPVPSPCI